jgi:DNA-directed RNA polymerase subunit RPC12/RpoP
MEEIEQLVGYDIRMKEKILNFLSLYKAKEYIYPSVFARNLKITKKEAENILNRILKTGTIKKVFQYRCSNCSHPVKAFYEEDSDDDIYCDNCDSIIDKNDKEYLYQCIVDLKTLKTK